MTAVSRPGFPLLIFRFPVDVDTCSLTQVIESMPEPYGIHSHAPLLPFQYLIYCCKEAPGEQISFSGFDD